MKQISKNRGNERSKLIQSELSEYDDYYYDGYYDSYYDDYDFSDEWFNLDWKYIDDSDTYINPNYGYSSRYRYQKTPIKIGVLIDMTSFYSKEVLRQKKIDEILGLGSLSNIRPKIEDFL